MTEGRREEGKKGTVKIDDPDKRNSRRARIGSNGKVIIIVYGEDGGDKKPRKKKKPLFF